MKQPASTAALTNARQSKPSALDRRALYGLAGEIIEFLEPSTEADPAAMLITLLTAFGNIVGRGPHLMLGPGNRHGTNLFSVIVGDSARARKGTALRAIMELLRPADLGWYEGCIQKGASTGEGIISRVRDAAAPGSGSGERREKADLGIADKRMLLVEEEFGAVLRRAETPSNTLSHVLREAWQTDSLSTATKINPLHATNPHISVIGHITRDELQKRLSQCELTNGFANRFIWFHAERSKRLAFPESLDPIRVVQLAGRLREAADFGANVGEVKLSEGAEVFWRNAYDGWLEDDEPGPSGKLMVRSSGHVLRTALIYALLDQQAVISFEHLLAAFAIWSRAQQTIRYLWGGSTGDALADRILAALQAAQGGLSRTDISKLFGNNKPKTVIDRALRDTMRDGLGFCRWNWIDKWRQKSGDLVRDRPRARSVTTVHSSALIRFFRLFRSSCQKCVVRSRRYRFLDRDRKCPCSALREPSTRRSSRCRSDATSNERDETNERRCLTTVS